MMERKSSGSRSARQPRRRRSRVGRSSIERDRRPCVAAAFKSSSAQVKEEPAASMLPGMDNLEGLEQAHKRSRTETDLGIAKPQQTSKFDQAGASLFAPSFVSCRERGPWQTKHDVQKKAESMIQKTTQLRRLVRDLTTNYDDPETKESLGKVPTLSHNTQGCCQAGGRN